MRALCAFFAGLLLAFPAFAQQTSIAQPTGCVAGVACAASTLALSSNGVAATIGDGTNIAVSTTFAGARGAVGYDGTRSYIAGGNAKGVQIWVNGSTAALNVASPGGEPSWLGTIPTVTGTGTPSIATGSTDTAGEVTSGSTATSVVITFSTSKTNAPFCTVTPQTQLAAFAYTISTTAITITQTATSAEKIDYVCFQH